MQCASSIATSDGLCLASISGEACYSKPFRRDKQELQFADQIIAEQTLREASRSRPEMDALDGEASLLEFIDLIIHQSDEWD